MREVGAAEILISGSGESPATDEFAAIYSVLLRSVWRLYWYTGGASPVEYHMFNHLLDGNGRLVSQIDAAVLSAGQWHERKLVVSHFQLLWPDDTERPLTMRSGIHSCPDMEAILIFEVAGNPYSDALEMVLS